MPKKVTFSEDTKGSRFDFATPINKSTKIDKISKAKLERDIKEQLKLVESTVNRLKKY